MLLTVDKVSISLRQQNGKSVDVVDQISFGLQPEKTLCLVGESGCGKTLTALSILDLLPPVAHVSTGDITFEGISLVRAPEQKCQSIRGNQIAMIFQDPMTSLNPVLRIREQIVEGFCFHTRHSRAEGMSQALTLLSQVGIADPVKCLSSFPHQLSGGMRQRVMIAMALMCSPRILIADEPTTALDVTMQRQLLLLLKQMVVDKGNSILLISHDFGVVSQLADFVAVMYAGMIVEFGTTADMLEQAFHPYTQGLLAASTLFSHGGRCHMLKAIPGVVPHVAERPHGCPFQPRCDVALPVCQKHKPVLQHGSADHSVACWRHV